MNSSNHHAVVNFSVRAHTPNSEFNVYEEGFQQPIAQFSDMETAEQYAMQLASTKANWKVDVYDAYGALAGTYNSEDDAMPKPTVSRQ